MFEYKNNVKNQIKKLYIVMNFPWEWNKDPKMLKFCVTNLNLKMCPHS